MRQATALRIIGLLRSQLDTGMTIREISQKLNIGYRPAYNHITEMQEQEIVTVKTVGNAKLCVLNVHNEKCRHFLEELDLSRKERLYKENTKLKVVLEALMTKLTQHYTDLQSIILFGSYAKGTANKTSDVDLLFVVSNLKDKTVREAIERECASIQYSHRLHISPMITDIKELKKMLSAKELNVGKESREYGIALYGLELFWRVIAWAA